MENVYPRTIEETVETKLVTHAFEAKESFGKVPLFSKEGVRTPVPSHKSIDVL